MKEWLLCENECESVSHVLWECPADGTLRNNFLVALQGMLGDEFEHFQSLGCFEKECCMLGSESWENKSGSMIDLVKSYVLDVWELRKVRLYGDNPSVQQSQYRIAPGKLQGVAGGGGELCLEGETDTGISVCSSSVCSFTVCSSVYLCTVSSLSSGSDHSSRCVVNGSSGKKQHLLLSMKHKLNTHWGAGIRR